MSGVRVVLCVVGLAGCGAGPPPGISGGGIPGLGIPSTGTPSGHDAGAHDAGAYDAGAAPGDAGTPSSERPSCAALPATCGAGANDDCCNSPVVAGGAFFRSFDSAQDPSSGSPSFPATVSGFRLDKYEVTVGRFRAFVVAGLGTQANPPPPGAGSHPNLPASGWDASWNSSLASDTPSLVAAIKCDPNLQTWTDAPGANEQRPMSCVTWFEALAFCAWDGGYLPTEAEWDYAAAGGDEQRAFPWSSPAGSLTLDPAHASYFDGTDCVGDGMAGCALTDLFVVGTKPAGDGRWGQSDLGGNVAEWMLDWASRYSNPCADCANLTPAAHREFRGGSFALGAAFMRSGTRVSRAPSDRTSINGVRCARSL